MSSLSTDKVFVYLQDSGAQKFNLFPATMLLMWRAPGSAAAASTTPASGSTVQLDDFKQNDLFSGYVTVKYNLAAAKGKIRVRVSDSANPKSAEWFESEPVDVKSGGGQQIVQLAVKADAKTPSDLFKADTIEISLLDDNDTVLATIKKETPMSWGKPK